MADLTVGLAGFTLTTVLLMGGLNRLDGIWIARRRRVGHDSATAC